MRKISCILLVLTIIFSFIFVSYAEGANENDVNNETNESIVKDLQTQQEELKNHIQQSNEELEGVQNELSENLQQVQKLDEKIANSEQEIEDLKNKISELKSSIEEIEAKLKVAEENYERQKEILEARLIAMYESGDTQYLDVVL